MIQYKVKPITRYIVTRYQNGANTGSVTERGQFDSYDTAYDVAYAMCKLEHDMAGTGPDDADFQYPRHKSDEGATPCQESLLDAQKVVARWATVVDAQKPARRNAGGSPPIG